MYLGNLIQNKLYINKFNVYASKTIYRKTGQKSEESFMSNYI